jgi:carboxypeptidase C (cathepsin A)
MSTTRRFLRTCRALAILLLAWGLLGGGAALAQQAQGEPKGRHIPPMPADQTTQGSVTVDGEQIRYDAVAATLPLFNGKRDTTAHMFYTAYVKRGVEDDAQRPVTFLYNGGPGSATMWLHMGSFGPVRIAAEDTSNVGGAPYRLVENPESLLDVTDLVFVDAPGTGFSRLTRHGEPDRFFGVDQDARAFADFVARFLTKHGRWNSPKYLFGESYGTTRSAVLASRLTTEKNVSLNGVIMLSQILDYTNSVDYPQRNPGNDRPYQLALPTYAATAWYHDELPNRPDSLEPFLQEVEDFAMGPYARALSKGNALSDQRFDEIARRLHEYTGLSVRFLKKADLRVGGGEFEKRLQADEDVTTGRLDTRYAGPTMDPLSQRSSYDPYSSGIGSAYVALLNQYMRETLDFGHNLTYRPAYRQDWDFEHGGFGIGMSVMPDLTEAMKHNPEMDVLVTGGYYDLATPYYQSIYEMQHLPIGERLQDNISYEYFRTGHMPYVRPETMPDLHDTVAAFIEQTDTVDSSG